MIDVQASDLDGETENGGGLTYSKTGGADQGLFSIDTDTGVLTFNAAPNFEIPTDVGGNNVYDVQVTVTDAGGLTDVQNIAVTVTNVNELPGITSAAAVDARENQTSVIDVQASDLDGETENGGGLTYSKTGGADQGLFSIDTDTGVLTFNAAPNFEIPTDVGGNNVYDVQVTVTDAGSLTDVQNIAVTVTNVNDAPAVANPIADVTVDQNAATDMFDLSSTFADEDAGDILTRSVIGNTDADLVSATINGTDLTLDYLPDQNGVAEITVRATDSGGLFVEETFIVIVLFTEYSDLRINGNSPDIEIFGDAGDLVVTRDNVESFRKSLDTFTGLVIDGPPQSNNFIVNLDNLSASQLPGGITINAGEQGASGNDSDKLTINGSQTVTNWEYTTGGPESGTIEMDGLLIIFTEFEPIIDNLTVTNRTFSIGTPGGQTIRLVDDGVPGNNRSTIDDGGTGAFEKITFTSPTQSLEINTGDGDDIVTVAQLDDDLGAVLTINVQDGDDSVDASNYNLPINISGGDGRDNLRGGTANDVINGGRGVDSIDGGPGNDDVDGGLGDDNIIVDEEDNIAVAEGDALTLVLSVAAAQEGDTGTIDWGDETTPDSVVVSGGTITATHIYREESAALPGGVYKSVLSINNTTREFEVVVENTPPTLVISGPGTVLDGAIYTLNLSGIDPGTDTISSWTITWGDGAVQPIVGNPSSVQHQYPDGLAAYSISATATDEDGTWSTNSLTVYAGDLPPVADINGPTNGVRGQTRVILLTATDTPPDETTGFTFLVDFGDGSSQMVSPTASNGSGLAVTHIYTDAGSYTINVTAIDQSSQSSQVVSLAIDIGIAELQDVPGNPGQTTLAIGGTTLNDDIQFTPGTNAGEIEVTVNGQSYGPFQPTGRLLAFGQAGDDDIQLAGSIDLSAWLYGDAGNDRLKGGAGHDVIFGGAGKDLLAGKGGRDLLIGGDGADRIIGNAGDDILIAGYTLFDFDANRRLNTTHEQSFFDIMAEWTSDRVHEVRVANLINGSGSSDRQNGNTFLNSKTVTDDNEKDVLTGSSGEDWFFFNPANDRATDLKDEIFADDLEFLLL